MELRKSLKLAHNLLQTEGIPHALIGGPGLSCYGLSRATLDVDLFGEWNAIMEIKNAC